MDMSFWDKLYQWGVVGNVYFWFHCAAGATLYALARWLLQEGKAASLFITFGLALGWELAEPTIDHWMGVPPVVINYGSLERYYFDSAGDILGAMAFALGIFLLESLGRDDGQEV